MVEMTDIITVDAADMSIENESYENTGLFMKSFSDMSPAEIEFIRRELDKRDKADLRAMMADIAKKQKEIEKVQTVLSNAQVKTDTKIKNITQEQKVHENKIILHEKRFDQLEKDTNVLSASRYKSVRNKFKNKASQRVYALLGGKLTPEYLLFSSYLYKKIYADIAKEFNLDTWDNIPMEDYLDSGSFFNKVEKYRDRWHPDKDYVLKRYFEMIKHRDNGFMAPEKCRALTAFSKSITETKRIRFLKEERIDL